MAHRFARPGTTLLCVALCWPGAAQAQERYGFVATLGRDTVSVEGITRTPTRLVSEGIERFPMVVRRHAEMRFGRDGRLQQLSMYYIVPSEKVVADQRLDIVVDFGDDSIRITQGTGKDRTRAALATGGALVVPWESQMYSHTEHLLATALARSGDSIPVLIVYPELEPEKQKLYPGFVRRLPGGRGEILIRAALSGPGEGTLDARGRMTSYSGARTTFKMDVVRTASLPDIERITEQFIATERTRGVAASMSPRDTVRTTIGSTSLRVDYGRPLQRGRELLGKVIPYGSVWRTGANNATQFTTSAAITLAGLDLAPGTYTLWTLPTPNGVELIVNRQFGQWGTQYDPARDLGRAPLRVTRDAQAVDQFTIAVRPEDGTHGVLEMAWGTFRWSAPIVIR